MEDHNDALGQSLVAETDRHGNGGAGPCNVEEEIVMNLQIQEQSAK